MTYVSPVSAEKVEEIGDSLRWGIRDKDTLIEAYRQYLIKFYAERDRIEGVVRNEVQQWATRELTSMQVEDFETHLPALEAFFRAYCAPSAG